MGIVGRWLGIQSYKHNGLLHRYWDRGLVLEDNEDYVVIATKRAKVVEFNGRRWFTREPAVTIFSKKQWWNVICMFKNDGICYYCNIASPSIINKDNIEYIDYDLDAKLLQNKEIKMLDEKEYANHRALYGYNDDLDKVLKFTTKEVIKKMENNEFPFKDDAIQAYYQKFLELTQKNK